MDDYTTIALEEIRNALWDRNEAIEPVGSPAYVRRLRDQAALEELPGCLNGKEGEAVDRADALVRALGYDPRGEPGKEG